MTFEFQRLFALLGVLCLVIGFVQKYLIVIIPGIAPSVFLYGGCGFVVLASLISRFVPSEDKEE